MVSAKTKTKKSLKKTTTPSAKKNTKTKPTKKTPKAKKTTPSKKNAPAKKTRKATAKKNTSSVNVKAVKKIKPKKQAKTAKKKVQEPSIVTPQKPSIGSPQLLELIKTPAMREFLTLSGGHDSIPLIESMLEHEDGAIDTVFAEKTSNKVTIIRTLLNRLHYRGLVDYTKTKEENSGWYTYKWFVKKEEILKELETRLQDSLEKEQEKKLMHEDHLIFSCENYCHKVVFEIAAEYAFRCPDCAQEMNALDTETEKQQIRLKIQELEEQIQQVSDFNKGIQA